MIDAAYVPLCFVDIPMMSTEAENAIGIYGPRVNNAGPRVISDGRRVRSDAAYGPLSIADIPVMFTEAENAIGIYGPVS